MEPSFKKEGTMHSPKNGKIPSAGIVVCENLKVRPTNCFRPILAFIAIKKAFVKKKV